MLSFVSRFTNAFSIPGKECKSHSRLTVLLCYKYSSAKSFPQIQHLKIWKPVDVDFTPHQSSP